MKEKFEAIDASQKLWLDIQYLQEQQAEWEKEKKDLTAKLISREEEEATLVVSPPSEGVWFAGSSKERRSLPKAHSSLLSTTHLSQRDGNLKTPPAEELPVPQIIVSPPTDSDGHPEPEVNKRSKRSPRPSAGGETTNVYLSPPSDPPSPRSPWASTPSRRALLDALGLPCLPGSPLDLVEPQPTRSVSRPPPPQPDLNDLVSQTASVGKDIHLRSPERRVPHDRSKLPRAHGDGPASRSHPINAPISTWRSRNAPSESPNWLASHEPQVDLSLLRRSASETPMVESRGGGMFMPASSLREEAGDPKPQKQSRLRKLLSKGRSVISRIL
ncbi:hypothetical protein FRC05_008424 [Tulasnella sp. 425]|nr:hypothetical protein FRC05_008424 [Tulasnella sp. 425]